MRHQKQFLSERWLTEVRGSLPVLLYTSPSSKTRKPQEEAPHVVFSTDHVKLFHISTLPQQQVAVLTKNVFSSVRSPPDTDQPPVRPTVRLLPTAGGLENHQALHGELTAYGGGIPPGLGPDGSPRGTRVR